MLIQLDSFQASLLNEIPTTAFQKIQFITESFLYKKIKLKKDIL